jgi:hypothetical protein
MMYGVLDSILFVLVLFVLVPGLVISVMMMSRGIHHYRRHAIWEKSKVSKTAA